MEMVDFKHLELTQKPNYYLTCPTQYCNVTPSEISPIFPVSMRILKQAWLQLINHQPRVKLIQSESEKNQYQYVQTSKVFHFPDYIDVQFIEISDDSSSLAIYSRARYGYYDFDVNKQRVQKWLAELPSYFHP